MNKKLIVAGVICIFFINTPVIAQDTTAKTTPKYPKEESVYIPKNLEECFIELHKILTKEQLEEFKNVKEEEVAKYHFDIGIWVRNNWQLWSPRSRLRKYFNEMGIFHPDDMSSMILTSFHRYLSNKDIKLDEQIRQHQNYWKQAAIEKANAYMQANYKNDIYLKDITKPSEARETPEGWIVYYEDKVLSRMPSGVELMIDKKTGGVRRLNQE